MAHPGGRPTKYSPELAKLICERIATNPVGWSTLEKLYPDMPNYSTVKAWRNAMPEFSKMYLEAKSFQSMILVEDIDELIPEAIEYYIDDKGNSRIDAPSASLLIAKINNRKWMAARLAPKIFGDKKTEETNNPQETLNKIQSLVADLNKTNVSDV